MPTEDTEDNTWSMDAMQRALDAVIRDRHTAKSPLREDQIKRLISKTGRKAGRIYARSLLESAPSMLAHRRNQISGFEQRNLERWQRPFDLLETIWVTCEELGENFNKNYRPKAVTDQNYTFEALTYLHAKGLLVSSEIICLLKGGFPDGAMARWRTLFETNVVATLIFHDTEDLALRYLAHSSVQDWERARDDAENLEQNDYLRARAEYAIEIFGEEIKRRNGWACKITNQKYPSTEKMIELAEKQADKELYQHSSLHVHSNHRALDDLLGMSEAEESLLLVGGSNSGFVPPLTLCSTVLVEITSLLLLSTPNMDSIAFVNSLLRMAKRMPKLASRVERRTLNASRVK